jgi:hypothetical protein
VRKFHARLRKLESWTMQESCADAPLVFLWPVLDYPEGHPPEATRCDKCGGFCGRVVLHEGEGPCEDFTSA